MKDIDDGSGYFTPEAVGGRFKRFRELLGQTRQDFAGQLGKPVKYIEELEAGKKLPAIPVLYYLYRTYRLDISWLINGSRDEESPHANDEGKGLPLPVEEVNAFCKREGLPVKEEYEALFRALQNKNAWKKVNSLLAEVKTMFELSIPGRS